MQDSLQQTQIHLARAEKRINDALRIIGAQDLTAMRIAPAPEVRKLLILLDQVHHALHHGVR